MSTLVLYASGHPHRYSSDEAEVRAIAGENARQRHGGLGTIDPDDPELRWWPSSVDFREEAARHARRPVGVGSFDAFLRAIRRARNLESVLFFGHGGDNLLKFGDTVYVRGADVTGDHDVSSSFAGAGRIILYACDAAHSPEFLARLASALRVTVCGFPGGVRWTLRWQGSAPNRRITWRGIARSSDGAGLPGNYTCAPPDVRPGNPADANRQRDALNSGTFTGATRFASPLRAGYRRPGPTA